MLKAIVPRPTEKRRRAAPAPLVKVAHDSAKVGSRGPGAAPPPRDPTFAESWSTFAHGAGAARRLVAVGLGTMAFSMEDILLEPYGGQILHLSVGATTKLTATLAIGGLLGFALADSRCDPVT